MKTVQANDYELFRIYPDRPTDDPDECLDDLCDSPNLSVPQESVEELSLPPLVANKYYPFENAASYLLTCRTNCEVREKSCEEIDELVYSVLLHPDFKAKDLLGYSSRHENNRLDGYVEDPTGHTPASADYNPSPRTHDARPLGQYCLSTAWVPPSTALPKVFRSRHFELMH